MTLYVAAKKDIYLQLKSIVSSSITILYKENNQLTDESLFLSDLIITELSQLEKFSKSFLLTHYEKMILLGNKDDDLKILTPLIQNSVKYFPSEYDIHDIFEYIVQYYHYYKCRLHSDKTGDTCIVGESNCISEIKDRILKFGPCSETVTILGETGSGKEIIAKALHNASKSTGVFLPINCNAMQDTLIESELFGSVKGAFTGSTDRKGFFEKAHNGTLFLDEIGDISLSVQSKLLRVIETKTVTPVGSTEQRKVNTRIITATSKNLKEMIKNGEFREDLYYRINTLIISVPPLREHKEDIPYLCTFFLNNRKMEKRLSTGALNKLIEHNWPGNIRELLSTIRRAEILSGYDKIIENKHISFH